MRKACEAGQVVGGLPSAQNVPGSGVVALPLHAGSSIFVYMVATPALHTGGGEEEGGELRRGGGGARAVVAAGGRLRRWSGGLGGAGGGHSGMLARSDADGTSCAEQ